MIAFINELLTQPDYNQTKPAQNGKNGGDFPDVDYLHGMKKHFCD